MLKQWLHFYFSFKGRATRYDFIVRYILVSLLVLAAAFGIDYLHNGGWYAMQVHADTFSKRPVYNICNLFVTVSCLAVSCRRLHDMNRSGWWQVAYFGAMIAVSAFSMYLMKMGGVNMVQDANPEQETTKQLALIIFSWVLVMGTALSFFLLLCLKRGTVGPNQYGADPLQSKTVETLS